MPVSPTWNPSVISSSEEHSARFEEVFAALWPRIHRFLIAVVGDYHEAEDLALEAFLRLHSRPRLLQPGQNPTAWLFRVAANLGYNSLRAAGRRRKYEAAAAQQGAGEAPQAGPEAQAERRQEVAEVRSVLAEMRPRAARLLLLRHAGLSYAELAETLRVAPGSVGSLLTRAEREFAQRYIRRYGRGV